MNLNQRYYRLPVGAHGDPSLFYIDEWAQLPNPDLGDSADMDSSVTINIQVSIDITSPYTANARRGETEIKTSHGPTS